MKKWTAISVIAFAAVIFLVLGCSQSDNANGVSLKEEKATLTKDLKQASQSVDKRLVEVDSELKDASGEATQELAAEQTRLQELKQNLGKTVDSVENQTRDSWQEFNRKARDVIISVESELGKDSTSTSTSTSSSDSPDTN